MLRHTKTILLRLHWPILLIMLALMSVGVAAIYISEQAEGGSIYFTPRQAIFSMLGIVAFLVAAIVPYQRIGRLAYAPLGLERGGDRLLHEAARRQDQGPLRPRLVRMEQPEAES